MGMGRFAGGFVVSEVSPKVFLEDTGTKGPCLGCDDDALLELSGRL